MVSVGQKAPNFKLLNQKKEEVTLEKLAGKNVVLAFYPGAFTGVCTTEMCAFRDSMSNFNEMNAVVVGVSVDSPFSNGAFAEKNKLNFDLLSDYKRETVRAFGVALDDFAGMPGYTAAKRAVFVLDETGTVRWSWVGETPKNEPDYEAVKKAVAGL
jgi:peroxiredoxin